MSKPGMDEIENILDPAIPMPEEMDAALTDILPRGYLSVSQMVMLLKCPYQWYLRYVEEKRPRTSIRPFQGIQVHRAADMVLKTRLTKGELPPLEAATDAYSDAFEEQKPIIDDWEGEEPGFAKDVGINCTKVFYQEAAVKATPVAVEKTFSTVIHSKDGKVKLPVLGRIDSIQVQTHTEKEYQDIREKVASDEKAKVPKPRRLHDLKVTTDKWSEGDLQNDLQFAIYAGVEHIPDVQVDQIVKGRAKIPRPRYEVLAGVLTNKEAHHAIAVADGVATTIALGHFPMTDPGNWWCSSKWCSMWEHCRGKK